MRRQWLLLVLALFIFTSSLPGQTPPDKTPDKTKDKGTDKDKDKDKGSGLDKEGFITRWLLLAPIPVPEAKPGEPDLLATEHIKGEAGLKPKADDKIKVGDKEFTWKPLQAKDFYFDVNDFLGKGIIENHIAYAVCYIQSEKELKGLEARIGSNDSSKLYLNGKSIFS